MTRRLLQLTCTALAVSLAACIQVDDGATTAGADVAAPADAAGAGDLPAADLGPPPDAAPDVAPDAAPDVGGGDVDPVTAALTFPLAGTGQDRCYSATGELPCPAAGAPFYGQDAQLGGPAPAYRDNGDGTVTDLVTGLMWAADLGAKVTWPDALDAADAMTLGGHDDWRLPTIKELYSLIDFRGGFTGDEASSTPYIDDTVFEFAYGDTAAGERPIDVQVWSATKYVSTTMNGDETIFGVNFADGRIKGYPQQQPGTTEERPMFARYVRGGAGYGVNDLVDHGDGTVTDRATGLMWQQADDGATRSWQEALAYCEDLTLAGHADWRLPDAKALQSIVDYTRAPALGSAAIDPTFAVSEIESYFWTSTSHLEGPADQAGHYAVYVAFGRALGYLETPPGSGDVQLLDVHGAGAQRSDPKAGDPADYPTGHGPQGDDIRIFNYARCVRSSSDA